MLIPKEVKNIIGKLKEAGYEAYIVGGCVRDFLLGIEPKDWDITTNAKPEEIQKVFPDSFYENNFLTVTVRTGSEKLAEVEITTYRSEAKYSDKRHPDQVKFAKTLQEDLSRRDFTINAIAIELKSEARNPKSETNSKSKIQNAKHVSNFDIRISNLRVIDPFGGQKDLKNKIIRTVGNPDERFSEDALRMLRAVRLATTLGLPSTTFATSPLSSEDNYPKNNANSKKSINREEGLPSTTFATSPLPSEDNYSKNNANSKKSINRESGAGFTIEEKTAEAIKKNSIWIEAISKERIRDEFLKIIMASDAALGIELLRQLGLLKFIVPELEENYGVGQNKHHIYDCYTHAIKALEYTARKKFSMQVRLAALFHDVAKPRVKVGDGINSTFYNHEVVGARMAFQILNRLKFSNKDIEKIVKLVRYHLFYYNVGEVSESSVRRLMKNIGPENMEDLLQVRQADRIGSGVPKAEPYKLRHLKYIIDKVSQDPISVGMLKVDGKDIMDILKIQPGPRVGQILDILLGHVLDDPKKNEKRFLVQEIEKLGKLEDKKLKELAEKSKEEKFEVQAQEDKKIKSKYWVK